MVRIVPALPRPPLRLAGQDSGVAIGLTMGVRVGGLLLLCYLGLLLCLCRGMAGSRRAPLASLLVAAGWTSLWRVLLPVARSPIAVMLLFWPWAQSDPIGNPLRALAFFSHETFPFNTLVRRPVCSGQRPALGLSADLHRPGAAGAGPRAAALRSGRGRRGRAGADGRLRLGGREPVLGPSSSGSRSSFRWPTRSRSRRCCSTACAISSLCCR